MNFCTSCQTIVPQDTQFFHHIGQDPSEVEKAKKNPKEKIEDIPFDKILHRSGFCGACLKTKHSIKQMKCGVCTNKIEFVKLNEVIMKVEDAIKRIPEFSEGASHEIDRPYAMIKFPDDKDQGCSPYRFTFSRISPVSPPHRLGWESNLIGCGSFL